MSALILQVETSNAVFLFKHFYIYVIHDLYIRNQYILYLLISSKAMEIQTDRGEKTVVLSHKIITPTSDYYS